MPPRSSTDVPPVGVELLEAFAEAWNRHDVDAILALMTEECVFESSAGPEVCGTRSVGREAVRAAFEEVWATFPDAHWGGARHFVHGDRGVSEWTFTGTRVDGTRVEVHGCDLFTLRDGKVIAFNGRETPTRGRELSVLEQLLGTVGRGTMLPNEDENVPGNRPGDRR